MSSHLLIDAGTTHAKQKCPYPDCESDFHLWEGSLLHEHLVIMHRGFYITKLRESGLHAEASEIAAK